MMKQESKLTTNQEQELAAELRAKTAGQEFESVEELLRHDATQVVVPPGIGERLRESAAKSEAPRRSWWRKWLE
jgi:hypothetical protein